MIAAAIDFVQEIEDAIAELAQPGARIPVKAITARMVDRHQNIEGADKDWYLVCAYHHVRQRVGSYFRHEKVEPEAPPDGLLNARAGHADQLVLTGFVHVQKAYLIDEIMVGIDVITWGELTSKIRELRTHSGGCIEHAVELERYRDTKFPPVHEG